MNGYQFCRELVADPELRDIPVVLMSAKGDQVGERFVKVMSIVDYITKPFSPDSITAVVQHAVAKHRQTGPAEDASPATADRSPAADVDRGDARRTALAHLRSSIVQLLTADAPRHAGIAEPATLAALRQTAETALDDAALARLLASLDLDLLGEAAPGLRGDLGVVPLAEVLRWLDGQRQSGRLTVERSGARVEIYVRRGRIEQAIATGVPDALRLGRLVVDAGAMTLADLDALRAAPPAQPALLGERLVAAGRLTEADLQACLTRQTSELIYEVLRWHDGRFQLATGIEPPAHVADAGLAFDLEAILLEGYRRVDEWHLIERAIDNFETVFLRNDDVLAQLGRGRLTRDELAVFDLVDGQLTVKEIVRRSQMSSFEVSKMLYRLLSIKLIRRRALPAAM
jgi:hypothetical protein